MESQERPGRLMELVGIAALSLAAISYLAGYFTGPLVATKATVTRSFVVTPGELSRPMYCSISARTAKSPRFTRVFYRYQIDGQQFLGEAVTETTTCDRPERIANSYHSGRETTVYVDRENPAESHLWPRGPTTKHFSYCWELPLTS